MIGVVKGPGHASWAITTCGFPPMLGIWGPSLACIAFDS